MQETPKHKQNNREVVCDRRLPVDTKVRRVPTPTTEIENWTKSRSFVRLVRDRMCRTGGTTTRATFISKSDNSDELLLKQTTMTTSDDATEDD